MIHTASQTNQSTTLGKSTKHNGKDDSAATPKRVTDPQAEWERLANIYRVNFENPALDSIKTLLAAVAAHRITAHPPAWMMGIAPSGSGKSTLESLRGLPGVYHIDEITPYTFISGKVDEPGNKRTQPASLLHRIGSQGVLVIADFSTYLAMDPKSQAKVLAQLRRIHDGHFSREFGTSDNLDERKWHGRLTLLAGATPEVDRRLLIHQSLGERFIKTRWQRAAGVETARRAMHQDESVMSALRKQTTRLLLPILKGDNQPAPTMSTRMEKALGNLSELICMARAYVPRERSNHEICDIAYAEGNTRLPQELAQIGQGWALVVGSPQVTTEGWGLMERAAMHCLPPARQIVLEALIRDQNPYSSDQLPATVIFRMLEDLEVLGVAKGTVVDKKKVYSLSDLARQLWNAAQFKP